MSGRRDTVRVDSANTATQLLCVNCGPALVVVMSAALLLGGWAPPISPAMSAAETVLLYAGDANRVRFACLLMLLASVLYWPFSVAISTQMRRIEGACHPLADTQLVASNGTVFAILLAPFTWMVAAFRPDTLPEVVQAMSDLGWLVFIGTIPPAMIQVLAFALCIFRQEDESRVFPRWFGFFLVWAATGFLAGEAIAFFKSGPFAWNGAVSFWLAATVFFGWIMVVWWMVRRAILLQAAQARDEGRA